MCHCYRADQLIIFLWWDSHTEVLNDLALLYTTQDARTECPINKKIHHICYHLDTLSLLVVSIALMRFICPKHLVVSHTLRLSLHGIIGTSPSKVFLSVTSMIIFINSHYFNTKQDASINFSCKLNVFIPNEQKTFASTTKYGMIWVTIVKT